MALHSSGVCHCYCAVVAAVKNSFSAKNWPKAGLKTPSASKGMYVLVKSNCSSDNEYQPKFGQWPY